MLAFMFGRAREVLPPPVSTADESAGTPRPTSLWPTLFWLTWLAATLLYSLVLGRFLEVV